MTVAVAVAVAVAVVVVVAAAIFFSSFDVDFVVDAHVYIDLIVDLYNSVTDWIVVAVTVCFAVVVLVCVSLYFDAAVAVSLFTATRNSSNMPKYPIYILKQFYLF